MQVILDHLYREGLFEVGDTLSREVHIEGSQAKHIFSDMHRLLKQVGTQDCAATCLSPAEHMHVESLLAFFSASCVVSAGAFRETLF